MAKKKHLDPREPAIDPEIPTERRRKKRKGDATKKQSIDETLPSSRSPSLPPPPPISKSTKSLGKASQRRSETTDEEETSESENGEKQHKSASEDETSDSSEGGEEKNIRTVPPANSGFTQPFPLRVTEYQDNLKISPIRFQVTTAADIALEIARVTRPRKARGNATASGPSHRNTRNQTLPEDLNSLGPNNTVFPEDDINNIFLPDNEIKVNISTTSIS